jgi:hypothetical protein
MNADAPEPPESAFAAGRLRVTEILGREASSILHPLECWASDGNRYFIKTRCSDKLPLVCEWVCSSLAHALGLRCPPVCIAWLPAPLLAASPYSDYDLVPGWAFGSQAVELADTFPKAVSKEVPAAERQRVLAFDHWINNCDRRDINPNLLWLAPEQALWLIDHHLTLSATPVRESQENHIFRDDWVACWTGQQGDAQRAWLQNGMQQLEGILAELPAEWLKDAGAFIENTRILLARQLP